ncbi:unnamed protein product [Linum tenue]|uniref:Alginate lyase 2 domain-containing protein n=1 Tax=Linum tenue TaxID=586396 RepID=A0AAV0LQD9_9ROSI|nr:unnamed protein product [Linum tenue]
MQVVVVAVLFVVVTWGSSVNGVVDVLDPTCGFTELPFNTSHYQIHKPFDLPVAQRYSFVDGIHDLWVYSTDKPLYNGSTTHPRSEIKIQGHDYSSGVWQFEGQAYVPSGTSGVCITQVFGASNQSTTLAVRVHGGNLTAYSTVIVPGISDRWFRLNVIHDVGAGKVFVHVDGALVYEGADHGGSSHYFKCGVYAQKDMSSYMESRWKEIQIFNKN